MDALSHLLALYPFKARLADKVQAIADPAASGKSNESAVSFHLVLAGHAVFEIDSIGRFDLEHGDLLVVAPGEHCRGHGDAAGMSELTQGHFLFSKSTGNILADSLPAAILLNRAARDAHPALQGVLTILSEEMRSQSAGGDAVVSQLLPSLFPLVLRAWLGLPSPRAPSVLELAADHRLHIALQAILAEPAKPWTIDQMALTTGMSRAQFARVFRDISGTTPAMLLMQTRMAQAAAWLRMDHSTGQVAAAIGYRSEAAFNRVFKRYFDITPGAYRRQTDAAILD